MIQTKKVNGLNQSFFPHMKVPVTVDEGVYIHISSAKKGKRKKGLWAKINRYHYAGLTATLVLVAGVVMIGPKNSSSFDTSSIDETIGEIDVFISYLNDDAQWEFDDL